MSLRRNAASLLGSDVPLNGTPKLLAHVLNLVQSISSVRSFPAVIQICQTGKVRGGTFYTIPPAEDVGNALSIQIDLLARVGRVYPLGVDAGVGYFCGNGMYAGTIYLRTDKVPLNLSDKLIRRNVSDEEKDRILRPIIADYASVFSISAEDCLKGSFIAIEADRSKSYSQLYAAV